MEIPKNLKVNEQLETQQELRAQFDTGRNAGRILSLGEVQGILVFFFYCSLFTEWMKLFCNRENSLISLPTAHCFFCGIIFLYTVNMCHSD